MLSFKQLLLSRTFWAIVGTFVFNGLQAVAPQILAADPHQTMLINGILTVIGVYGRMKPRQQPRP